MTQAALEKVGALAKRVYPQYAKVTDLARLGEAYLGTALKKPDLLDQLLDVQSVYDPKAGRFVSRWRTKKSADQTALLLQLMNQGGAILGLIQQRYAIQDLLDAREIKQLQDEVLREQLQTQVHQERYKQAEILSAAEILKLATQRGMAVSDFLEYQKKKAFEEIELHSRAERAKQDQENADRLDLLNSILVSKLADRFSEVVAQIFQIESDPNMPRIMKDENIRLLNAVKAGIEKEIKDRMK